MRSRRAALALAAFLALAGCSSSGDDPDGPTTDGAGQEEVVEVPGATLIGDSAAISPDGSRLAVPCDGQLCVWTTGDGVLGEVWGGGSVVAWGPADLVATDRVEDGTVSVVLLDATTGEETAAADAYASETEQDGPGDGLLDLAFSSDGETLAGVGADGVVRLWSATDLTDVVEIDADGEAPVAVAFDPDGSRVALASSDAAVAIHDARTGEALGYLDGAPQGDVAWSADGSWIAGASFAYDDEAATTVWDAGDLTVEATLPRPGYRLAFTPGSDAVVLSEKRATDLVVWSWSDDGVALRVGATGDLRAVLAAGSSLYAVSPSDGVLEWDASGGLRTFDPPGATDGP